jgi:gluconate kinase
MNEAIQNINNNQKEERLKDRRKHFLAIKCGGILFIYCKRCGEFFPVVLVNINDVLIEVRLKDRCGHFVGKRHGNVVFIYCKRCKEFTQVIMDEETK